MGTKKTTRIITPPVAARPHGGEGRPDLWFPDPVTGEKIGGQVALVRQAMRYQHVVAPWARRQGKSKTRQFLWVNEAAITPGEYYVGCCYPDHTTAAKIADDFRRSWGDLVLSHKINDKDQDRWIELKPTTIPVGMEPPAWFTPRLRARWEAVQSTPNTRIKAYFWGAAHPHYEKIQGFPHHFNRVDWDEAQQIHPNAYGIVMPMIEDVQGHELITGTPWHSGIGNVQFEKWWDMADPEDTAPGWFRMRIPAGANPYVKSTPLHIARRKMTEQQVQQVMLARFLTGEGAVFGNLDEVFVLDPIPNDHPDHNFVKAIRARFSMPSMEWWLHEGAPHQDHIYGASIDWARRPKGDYSVLGVYDFSTGRQVALFRWRGEDFTNQMEAVLAIVQHYNAQQLHSDQNGMGEPMADFLRRRYHLGFIGHKFGKNKGTYVRRLQVLFMDADIALIDCPAQRREFKIFSAFESEGLGSEKQIKYCAPEGEHDDFVASCLQIAPTIAISGRQVAPKPAPPPPPTFDADGTTTLERFAEGLPLPFKNPADASWQDVILPPGY